MVAKVFFHLELPKKLSQITKSDAGDADIGIPGRGKRRLVTRWGKPANIGTLTRLRERIATVKTA